MASQMPESKDAELSGSASSSTSLASPNSSVTTAAAAKKYCGLANQGATCYMNSLLQVRTLKCGY